MHRAEKLGLGAATAGHVVLFGLLSVGFLATPNPLKIERNPVEVTFADDVGLEATAPRASQQPPATSVAPELGKPDPATPSPAELAPEPVPVPTPKPAKPPVRAEQPKKTAAQSKPERPKGARLGPDFLKGITEQASASRSTQATAPVIGAREQASLKAELKRQLKPHWRPPSGADVEKLRVTIVANLSEDGSIVGEPRVVGPSGVTPSNKAQVGPFVERAIAAVKRAAPYNFPKQYYAAWRRIEPQLYEGL